MSHSCCGGAEVGAERRAPAALSVADGLALAALPTFAIMALVSAMPGDGAAAMPCGGGQGSPLGGMVVMYLLMSAFHAAPWLRLLSGRRSPAPLREEAAQDVRPSPRNEPTGGAARIGA